VKYIFGQLEDHSFTVKISCLKAIYSFVCNDQYNYSIDFFTSRSISLILSFIEVDDFDLIYPTIHLLNISIQKFPKQSRLITIYDECMTRELFERFHGLIDSDEFPPKIQE
jgi:hypothetical protein